MYPPQALKEGVSGKVVLRIDVAADGTPANVEVASAEPAGVFDQASVDAAQRWRFAPKFKDGRAVAYSVRVPVKFVADEAKAPVPPTR